MTANFYFYSGFTLTVWNQMIFASLLYAYYSSPVKERVFQKDVSYVPKNICKSNHFNQQMFLIKLYLFTFFPLHPLCIYRNYLINRYPHQRLLFSFCANARAFLKSSWFGLPLFIPPKYLRKTLVLNPLQLNSSTMR